MAETDDLERKARAISEQIIAGDEPAQGGRDLAVIFLRLTKLLEGDAMTDPQPFPRVWQTYERRY
jgi:hypothetical protein